MFHRRHKHPTDTNLVRMYLEDTSHQLIAKPVKGAHLSRLSGGPALHRHLGRWTQSYWPRLGWSQGPPTVSLTACFSQQIHQPFHWSHCLCLWLYLLAHITSTSAVPVMVSIPPHSYTHWHTQTLTQAHTHTQTLYNCVGWFKSDHTVLYLNMTQNRIYHQIEFCILPPALPQ